MLNQGKLRITSLILTAVMLTSCLTACGNNPAATTATTAVTTAATEAVTSSASTEPEEIELLSNPNFKIELLSDGIKRVTDADGRKLILVPKALSEVPEEYADSIVVRTPVDNAVFLSTTQVCTFRTIDDAAVIDAIGGVCGGTDTWSTVPAVGEKLNSGDIIDVTGSDGMGAPDYEKIKALEPDIVFVYSGEYGQVNEMAKLDELGINYAVDNEYLESDYLARMEWMRFILTFFDADEAVDVVMSRAKDNIDAAKAATSGKDKLKVALFSVFDGVVYATGDDSWLGTMLTDMNGENVFTPLTDKNVTMEAAYEYIQSADIIIYASTPAYCAGMSAVEEAFPQLKDCVAYENDRVYEYSDMFWNGIDESDIMATDFAAVLYPDAFPGRELSYFLKLEK